MDHLDQRRLLKKEIGLDEPSKDTLGGEITIIRKSGAVERYTFTSRADDEGNFDPTATTIAKRIPDDSENTK